MQTNHQKLHIDSDIIVNKLHRSTLNRWSIGTIIFSIMLLPVAFSGCKKPEPDPIPVVKTLDQSVSLQNKTELVYKATLDNVNSAKLVVNKDGVLIFSEDISDVVSTGPDVQMTYKYVKDDPKLKNITKGKYEFILTSNDSSEKLEKKSAIEIINYLPTANTAVLDNSKLNFMEAFETTLSIPKSIFIDDNPEDNPVSVTVVKSVDGKTTPTITTTSTGYDLNVKAVTGNTGTYQLELDFGSTTGGLEKTILSGQIGKDTRIVINPKISTDDNGTEYNSKTTKLDRDNYLLGQLILRPRIPYSDKYYTCFNYGFQLFDDSHKLGKVRAPYSDYGKYWLYNNSTSTNLDSIYANGGTKDREGTIGAPMLIVYLTDISHSPPTDPLRHEMNAVLTGRDMSTGNLLTNFANYDMIEPQGPAINVQIGTHQLLSDCDKVEIIDSFIVEDPIIGNYLQDVTLAKFRIDKGVATCTWENTDTKYNIIKQ